MEVRIVVAIGLLSLYLATLSFAYDEPDNFTGIKFGEDVRTQLPQCPDWAELLRNNRGATGTELQKMSQEAMSKPCYAPAAPGLDNTGELKYVGGIRQLVNKILYTQVNNKLERIQLPFSPSNKSALLSDSKTEIWRADIHVGRTVAITGWC